MHKLRTSLSFLPVLFLAVTAACYAQQTDLPWSQKMANAAIARAANTKQDKWLYEQGALMTGMENVWYSTADPRYFDFIKQQMDQLVQPDGSVPAYHADQKSLDNIAEGRQLLLLYAVTQDARYLKAAQQLRAQLDVQSRTKSGGFWHKERYPEQMWLDGLYMGEPFYAEYAATFQQTAAFDDIAKQFELMEQHARDPKTGLLYHAWNEDKAQPWANKATGTSPSFWSRGMGWYAMALVDTLPYFPESHPQRAELIAILNRLAKAVSAYQDPKTGVWWQVTDKIGEKGNYPESSASAMFVYALAKGVRLGYLPVTYQGAAKRGFDGMLKTFVTTGADGMPELKDTVYGIGLGNFGKENRDGSYAYYTSVERVSNDPRGVGPFLSAAAEVEMIPKVKLGLGKTVLLDSWYNSQLEKNAAGNMVPWHYKWEEKKNSGYFFAGHVFRSYGVKTETLYTAPAAADLAKTDIYLIVDPNNPAKKPQPNYMTAEQAQTIADWVKKGGVLVLMNNDINNADFDHYNLLADKFGLHFNADLKNPVTGNQYEMGHVLIDGPNPIFKTGRKFYLKEVCTIKLSGDAKPVITWKGDVFAAMTRYGKGTVFAIGDPWFYDEYADGRKLPMSFENIQGADDLAKWLVQQAPVKK